MAYSAWDKFLAFAAPHSLQALQNYNDQRAGTEDLSRFSADPRGFRFDPTRYEQASNAAKMAEHFTGQTDLMQRGDAAPFEATARSYLRDPEFRKDPAALQEFASRPDFWLGANDTGSVPGAKKGVSVGGNPYVSDVVNRFGGAAQSAGTAMGAAQGNPADLAWLATDKDLAAGFDNSQQGRERINKQANVERGVATNAALGAYLANTPLERNIESWNRFASGARLIPGVDQKEIDATLKSIADRNRTPVKQMEMKVGNGPNSTKKLVWVDMFGDPVADASVQSSNNPSDREQGLIPGDSGPAKQIATISFPGPDGTPITREIDLSTVGNDQVASRAVDEAKRGTPGYSVTIPQRDKRGNVTFKTYGKTGKEKKQWAPGGAAAPAAPAAAANDPLGIRR